MSVICIKSITTIYNILYIVLVLVRKKNWFCISVYNNNRELLNQENTFIFLFLYSNTKVDTKFYLFVSVAVDMKNMINIFKLFMQKKVFFSIKTYFNVNTVSSFVYFMLCLIPSKTYSFLIQIISDGFIEVCKENKYELRNYGKQFFTSKKIFFGTKLHLTIKFPFVTVIVVFFFSFLC